MCSCMLEPQFHTSLRSFFFNDTATTDIYTLSLHDALPISFPASRCGSSSTPWPAIPTTRWARARRARSEEHTSELQSRGHLVCRLLLEKKNTRDHHDDSARFLPGLGQRLAPRLRVLQRGRR